MGVLTIKAGGVEVSLIDDDRICGLIKRQGDFEPFTLEAWAALCQPDKIALDVGAYSGLFSLIAAKKGAKAVAIEPVPGMQDRIRENMALNKVDFELVEAAASNYNGRVWIGTNPKVKFSAGASVLRKSDQINVRAVMLDDWKDQPVAAVKIDVERYEQTVLEGAMQMLHKQRPKLIVEVLEVEAKMAVKRTLRGIYRGTRTMDVRNMLMEPIDHA